MSPLFFFRRQENEQEKRQENEQERTSRQEKELAEVQTKRIVREGKREEGTGMNLTLKEVRKTFTDRRPQAIGKHRFFSVLIPLVEKDGKLNLLFEVRARHMESQPGEVCFPGGHVEPDEEPSVCAVRETFEEIGIPAEEIELIGPGNILHGYANYTLYTYLGVISYDSYCRAKLSPDEVEEIFLVPLSKFKETKPMIFDEHIRTEIDKAFPYEMVGIEKDYKWRVGEWSIPIYDIDGRIIWGLTARITGNLIETLEEAVKGGRV